jgi:hypothetical protein
MGPVFGNADDTNLTVFTQNQAVSANHESSIVEPTVFISFQMAQEDGDFQFDGGPAKSAGPFICGGANPIAAQTTKEPIPRKTQFRCDDPFCPAVCCDGRRLLDQATVPFELPDLGCNVQQRYPQNGHAVDETIMVPSETLRNRSAISFNMDELIGTVAPCMKETRVSRLAGTRCVRPVLRSICNSADRSSLMAKGLV